MRQESFGNALDLKDEVRRLREQVIDVLWSVDIAEQVRKPELEAQLIRSFSLPLVQLRRSEIELQKVQLMFDEANALHEKNALVDIDALREKANAQFASAERKVLRKQRACSAILHRQEELSAISHEEWEEVEDLHRTLVARLHPFLNPHGGSYGKSKLALGRLALKRGDVQMMRCLLAITEAQEQGAMSWEWLSADDELNAELALTEARASIANRKLEQLLESRPFDVESVFDDVRGECLRESSTEEQIRELDARRAAYEVRLAELQRRTA